MSEWKEIELGKLAEVQTGPFGSQLHQEDYVPIGTPLITVKNLGENKVTYNKLDFVSDRDKERLSKFILKEGDIVFSRVGYVDRRAFITKKESGWLFSGSTLRVRVRETSILNPKYLSYYFGQKRFKDDIKNMSVGATRPSLNTQLLEEVEILLPPLPEQHSIASILSSLDDKIDLLHRQNRTLEGMAEALFRQWFVEEADEGWGTGKLGDIADFYNGKSRPESSEGGSVPIYGGNGILGYTVQSNADGKSIIIGRVGAYCGSLYIENKPIWITDNALSAKPKNGRSTSYLFYLLKSLNLNQMAEGSSHPLITQTLLNTIEVIIPSNEKLYAFCDYADNMREKIFFNQSQICTLEKLRDMLLPKLMSGEVRVEVEESKYEN